MKSADMLFMLTMPNSRWKAFRKVAASKLAGLKPEMRPFISWPEGGAFLAKLSYADWLLYSKHIQHLRKEMADDIKEYKVRHKRDKINAYMREYMAKRRKEAKRDTPT